MVQSGKKCSSLVFWKHGAVNEFYGSIDVSSQMRGAEFPVIYGLEKPKLLLTGTYTSTSTRHVTLNLLSFYSFRIVNCAIMIINNQIIDQWIFCSVQKPYLLILANLQSSKRKKKETLPFSYWFSPTCISLNVKFSIPTRNLESFSLFLAFLVNRLVQRAKKCRFVWSSDRLEQELRDRCSWEKLVTVANFRRHPRQKYGGAQRIFWWFSEMKWWIIKGN